MEKGGVITLTERPLWIRLKGEVPYVEKVNVLLAPLKEACQRLPSPYHNQISQDISIWENSYPKHKTDFQRGIALCVLCFNTVEYVMLFLTETREDKALWLKVWQGLTTILKDNFSPNFIESYKQRQAALVTLPKKKEYISALFEKFEAELYAQANEMFQFSVEAFEKCKRDFLQLQTDGDDSKEQVRKYVDALTEQVIQLFLTFRENIHEMEDLENKVKQEDAQSLQNLDDLEKFINRV